MASNDNSDIAQMSDEQLMEEWTSYGAQFAKAKERLDAFSAEHQRRSRKADLQRLADLSDEDMALLQEVRAEGVETAEAVGSVGGEEVSG